MLYSLYAIDYDFGNLSKNIHSFSHHAIRRWNNDQRKKCVESDDCSSTTIEQRFSQS